jgi:hypothetical protein
MGINSAASQAMYDGYTGNSSRQQLMYYRWGVGLTSCVVAFCGHWCASCSTLLPCTCPFQTRPFFYCGIVAWFLLNLYLCVVIYIVWSYEGLRTL